MKKSLSFCFPCRIACLAVLISCLFTACGGEENSSGDENSSPDTYTVDNDTYNNTDEHLAEVNEENSDDSTDTGIDPPEEVEAEATSSCEDYDWLNGTFDCCGENEVCTYNAECKLKECKLYCTDTLDGPTIPSDKIEMTPPTKFFIKPTTVTCIKEK